MSNSEFHNFSASRGIDNTAKGFHMTFDNGWTVSVQWGKGNYASNILNYEGFMTASSAEIAAWDTNGNYYNFGHDTVKGRQSPNEVLNFMVTISKLPK